ncbi:ceramide synthase 6 [Plakobranchus ocellatus]|uniref:Ceramide synthase 6 n=1 Tax=Plakobranchus ocellatus TaxID=259542 RepID=A0AAV3YDC4_9GAST|nr:ceramide synthase 6 [Plakobranchus ocellatus]
MASIWNSLHDFIWNEEFWLGDDAEWKDFESSDPSIYYPQLRHMNWSIVVGVGLVFVRMLYENLGASKDSSVSHETLPGQHATSTTKVCWTFIQSVLYLSVENLILNLLLQYPEMHIDTEIFILYLLELSFYWSLLFAILFQRDYQKKDKTEMIIHHIVTILLIYFSWACNFVRVGSLVIVVHDLADPWLSIAKMAKYTKHQTTCEIFFAMFILTWITSRIFIYPLWVLNASAIEIHDYVTTFPAYWFFNGLLIVLQLLHIMWTYLILSIAFQKLTLGTIEKDIRSESDSELSESSEEEKVDGLPSKQLQSSVTNGISSQSVVNRK